ncbi:hypothetical protein OUZ56_033158 [Daphnia magna]|uniref:Uncharacterized protein n=1 Tax=Daphnia magna TaxID=35525 RepID=A0ABR0BAC7_9CRUS|nr:hypothetical protein OUZ56_033158 [Daphnia magna]
MKRLGRCVWFALFGAGCVAPTRAPIPAVAHRTRSPGATPPSGTPATAPVDQDRAPVEGPLRKPFATYMDDAPGPLFVAIDGMCIHMTTLLPGGLSGAESPPAAVVVTGTEGGPWGRGGSVHFAKFVGDSLVDAPFPSLTKSAKPGQEPPVARATFVRGIWETADATFFEIDRTGRMVSNADLLRVPNPDRGGAATFFMHPLGADGMNLPLWFHGIDAIAGGELRGRWRCAPMTTRSSRRGSSALGRRHRLLRESQFFWAVACIFLAPVGGVRRGADGGWDVEQRAGARGMARPSRGVYRRTTADVSTGGSPFRDSPVARRRGVPLCRRPPGLSGAERPNRRCQPPRSGAACNAPRSLKKLPSRFEGGTLVCAWWRSRHCIPGWRRRTTGPPRADCHRRVESDGGPIPGEIAGWRRGWGRLEVSLPKPPFSRSGARYRAVRVAVRAAGDAYINAEHGEKGIGWSTPERYRAVLRSVRPAETLRCQEPDRGNNAGAGDGFMSFAPAATPGCTHPFALLLRGNSRKGLESEAKALLNALGKTPQMPKTGIQFVAGTRNYFGIPVASVEEGDALARAAVAAKFEQRPEILCGVPEGIPVSGP